MTLDSTTSGQAEGSRPATAADFVDTLDTIPHQAPMRFVDEILDATLSSIRTRATLGPTHIACEPDGLSPLILVEMFAQSAAALMVWRARRTASRPISNGLLLGTREMHFYVPRLAVGDEIELEVHEVWSNPPLSQFHGTAWRSGQRIASGSINVASS
jgi:predicted hotdog family 3-hydroxylacyl-ACP dehydratase